MTKSEFIKQQKEIIKAHKDNTAYFDGSFSEQDMYSMLRFRMHFGEDETAVIIAALKLAGAKFKEENKEKTYYSAVTTIDNNGEVRCDIVDSVVAESKPESSYNSTSLKDIYVDWFDSRAEAEKFVEEARKA